MEYEFKGSTVEAAIEKGLKKLDLKRDDVKIEIINEESGIFSRAAVRLTVKTEEEKEKVEKTVTEENRENTVETVEEVEKTEDTAEKEEETVEENTVGEEEVRKYRDRKRTDGDRNGMRERKPHPFAEEKEIGKKFIGEMAEFFTNGTRVDAKSFDDEICFYIGGENTNVFIGHRGETLDAIQYLAGQVVNKNREEHIRVTVDCDFYRERRKRTLTMLAKKIAKDACAQNKEIALEPMNSYERRIIHSALQDSDLAETRSDGEGKDRHVVIIPKRSMMTYGNVNSDFKKHGPSKTKSFGQKRMKF